MKLPISQLHSARNYVQGAIRIPQLTICSFSTGRANLFPAQPISKTNHQNRYSSLRPRKQQQQPQHNITKITAIRVNMSSTFSNADTGSKNADPYKEKNLDGVSSIKEKVEDLSEFITSCKFGMMTTRDGSTGKLLSRCMALAAKETGGIDLIFHTNTESGKTDDLSSDPHVNIAFLNGSGEWASLSGLASIVTDRETVRKYYSPSLKSWLGDLGDGKHNGGPEDPRIAVIRVRTETATYAVVRKNVASRAMDMAQGVVTGSTPQVNKLRELSEVEVETWRTSRNMVE